MRARSIPGYEVTQNSPQDNHVYSRNRWRTAALLLGLGLVIIAGLYISMLVSGWRFERVGRKTPGGASAERWSPSLGPGEGAVSRLKRLAHDVSLSLAATNRPDPNKILQEAKDLARKGQFEEALQRHIWCHNHALEYDPAQAGSYNSFALQSWIELGREYPKARQALVEIRDRETRGFNEGVGDFSVFQEVASINREWKEESKTVALFKTILQRDRGLARQCCWVVEGPLVQEGEYQTCLDAISDADAHFAILRQTWEGQSRMPRLPIPPTSDARLQKFMEDQNARCRWAGESSFRECTRIPSPSTALTQNSEKTGAT